MKKLMMWLMLVCFGVNANAVGRSSLMELPPFERAVLIIKYYESLHHPKDYPYVGFGHRVLPGEPYYKGIQFTEAQAETLLRNDLRKFVALYDHLPKYKLLLGVLAYNIGPGAVNKSSVYKKLIRGDTNIYKEYTSHCHYNGKWHKQLNDRRRMEYHLLFTP